jgi:hypothetical protein
MIYMNQILGDKNKRLTDYLMELQALRDLVPNMLKLQEHQRQSGKLAPY